MAGMKWTKNGWVFSQEKDDRSPVRRTIEEINKSLNDTWKFLEFTTEEESDFPDGFLPTLDFATRVESNGYVQYKFFKKPMASNLLLQNGTALSKGCLFSSLRQDLVRRLYNSNLTMGAEFRNTLVGDYIQLLVNSGHKFVYIKSIVLQALTKFHYMVSRSCLPASNKKYMPLHRSRNFMGDTRKLIKYTSTQGRTTRINTVTPGNNGYVGWVKTTRNLSQERSMNQMKLM